MRRWAAPVLLLAVTVGVLLGVKACQDGPAPKPRAAPVVSQTPTPMATKRTPQPRARRIPAPTPKPSGLIPPGLVIYTVVRDDTLSGIAWRFGTSTTSLYLWNGRTVGPNPDYIVPGQQLVVGKVATA